MGNPTFTLRLKLILTFGTSMVLMVAVGCLGAFTFRYLELNALPRFQLALQLLIGAAALACGVMGYGGYHLHQVICGGLERQRRKFAEIANTLDLTKRSSSPRMDEFGRSARAFDTLMRRVEDTVSVVQGSLLAVNTATREIAMGNHDLSARTEAQAASLERTASSMAQLTETVKLNADSTRHASALAMTAMQAAEAGSAVVAEMVRTIDSVSGSSARISDITSAIEGIAFQTNILALNASVEAARAGDLGKGFSVVAGEVRALAQRAASAAREIKDLISSSVALIQASARQVNEVSASMREIKGVATQVSDTVRNVAGATDEQSRNIEQINQVVAHMDQVTQQNAALVEQTAAAAESLAEQAVALGVAVSLFKIHTGAAPAVEIPVAEVTKLR
ncbi:methyl-accepting chemotaxis protein [Ralstonia soli]|uniref:Methyl-accepting chemotaxis protein n=1 Tax=Ralstonia soli TaxID=2953896 RepID=A0ABT1AL67_9RALS|nr:methyl-accepting chemotaxis protein [Ralstonia soli]MCO5399071.1 methyl-accepting chemotaxis protein [Ralstonia soli]